MISATFDWQLAVVSLAVLLAAVAAARRLLPVRWRVAWLRSLERSLPTHAVFLSLCSRLLLRNADEANLAAASGCSHCPAATGRPRT